jgi:hypothetical protein
MTLTDRSSFAIGGDSKDGLAANVIATASHRRAGLIFNTGLTGPASAPDDGTANEHD